MKVLFSSKGWEHYLYWVETDRSTLLRLNKLIEECRRTPFSGLGKPEPLRGEFKGFWSRRINEEDRLVYRIMGTAETQTIEIVACRYHYK
ncbi:Txe/YoeB family addiction module toxin [Pararhizobium sp. BT-229]|uniref:Txe/YoeB family addiction module toxin n=1 Tax=Pararhizobium sp. BT-229 TaxID=2986923 RepID=UPI0021F7560E|nr:Txe/YoeB family addiction module toxin [Pararhizobium sp. BT-229]MCV9965650.1 Txe/YoeB family addiction module toxin [Pararhizobium sp. BT-229]